MSIRLQLPLIFTISLVALLAVAALSLVEMHGLHTVAVESKEVSLPALTQVGRLQLAALRHRGVVAELRAAGAAGPVLAELDRAAAELAEQLARHRPPVADGAVGGPPTEAERLWRAYLDEARAAPLAPAAAFAPQLEALDAELERLAVRVRAEAEGRAANITTTYDAARTVVLVISLLSVMFSLTAGIPIALDLARDLTELTAATAAVAADNLDQKVAHDSNNELGRLGAAFNLMVERLRASRDEVAVRQAAVEQRNADLERALAELHSASAAREQLSASIRSLSSPVVTVAEGVLAMPLIGVIDAERAAIVIETMLAAIERERAQAVIIDVTGVPVIDDVVAAALLRAAGAARLLGARPILTGIRPELAQTIVGLGIDLAGITAHADLRTGLVAVRGR